MHLFNKFQQKNNPKLTINNRFIYVIFITIFLSILLISRLYFLQVVEVEKYATLSKKNQLTIIPHEAKRGVIFDRNGKVLATNSAIYNIDIVPQIAKKTSPIFEKLLELKLISEDEISQFKKNRYLHRPYEAITIKENISEKDAAILSTHLFELPGVYISAKLIRNYPYGEIISHILGYTGLITEKESNNIGGNYLSHQQIGKIGVEKKYEQLLHGELGYEQVEVDAKGRIIKSKDFIPPISGHDLYLTIDIELQKQVYEIMKGYKGAAIVLNAKTGEVLAMVSVPSYDNNVLLSHKKDNKKLINIFNDPNKPMYNRIINGLYPLASPIKPFLAIQGLEQKKITPKYQLFDPGWYKLPNSKHIFRDVSYNVGGHGWIDLHKSIVKSSDTYYYHLASLLGIKSMHAILSKFGFGKSTHIDLWGESIGLVPTKSWKMMAKSEPWYKGDSLLIGIGQGFIQVTPIQMAQATMLMANRGRGYHPHILGKSIDQFGKVQEFEKTPIPQIKLSREIYWQWIHNAMRGVIHQNGGTGWRFGKDAPYISAGKTGTGQIISLHHNVNIDKDNIPDHLKDHSSFIVFAPFNNPEIAVSILIENMPGSASLARQICDAYFTNIGLIKPNKPDITS